MKAPLILATGFSAFPGAPENPTAWAMEELERTGWQPAGARLVVRTLPVTFEMWSTTMFPLLSALQPEAVVSFGLSAKAMGVTLESTARNCVATNRPDFTGACSGTGCVNQHGPALYPSRLPLREIAGRLQQSGVPMVRSDDAGDYVCNMLFYKLMAAAEGSGPKVAGFVHVPYLERQAQRLKAAGLSIECGSVLNESQLLLGIESIICAVALRLQGE